MGNTLFTFNLNVDIFRTKQANKGEDNFVNIGGKSKVFTIDKLQLYRICVISSRDKENKHTKKIYTIVFVSVLPQEARVRSIHQINQFRRTENVSRTKCLRK